MADLAVHETPVGPIRVHKPKGLEMYWRYIYERQAIWYKRFVLREPRPWTTDPTLNTYSFTNVYRELDRGTIHYREVAWPQIERVHNTHRQLWWTAIYRWFNRPEVWDEALAPLCVEGVPDFEAIEAALRQFTRTGRPVFTGAYMVCAYHGFEGLDKIARIINFLRHIYANSDLLWVDNSKFPRSTEAWHAACQKFDGIGPFGAYEIMSDLLMVKWAPFEERGWTEDDWANPGPGAERGLKLVYPNSKSYSRANMVSMMRNLRDIQREAFIILSLPFGEVSLKRADKTTIWLSMRNIEHNLCELSKYERGYCRSKFTQRTY